MKTLEQAPVAAVAPNRPIVYKIAPGSFIPTLRQSPTSSPGRVAWRAKVRSLEGMQKEAIVAPMDESGDAWRLLCDEGPYLDGTDLAPFPLAFYSTGMEFSFLGELTRLAIEGGVEFDSIEVVQDNFYTMKGSFIRGDAVGGAKSARILLRVRGGVSAEETLHLARAALDASPGEAGMRQPIGSRFSLRLNGAPVDLPGEVGGLAPDADDPVEEFGNLKPASHGWKEDIIVKIMEVEKKHGVAGGVSSSLQPVQDRTLHVHANGKAFFDGAYRETDVALLSPLGSTFRFCGDEQVARGGQASAPPAAAYRAAGIAFCYLTQLSRYAAIVKAPLHSVRLVQDTAAHPAGSRGGEVRMEAEPVRTQVFMDADFDAAMAATVVGVGARTCFLHAALRGAFPTQLRVELNGIAME